MTFAGVFSRIMSLAIAVGGIALIGSAQAQLREKVLHSFPIGTNDGSFPSFGALIRDGKSNFYGTTESGGNTGRGINTGCGTVYRVSPKREETVLYAFCQA